MSTLGIGAASAQAAPGAARDDTLRSAARQLEGIFVSLMFEEMAKTVDEAGLLPKTPGGDMYQQWFRGAVAEQWSASGGLGLGDRIAESLGASTAVSDLRRALLDATAKTGAADRFEGGGSLSGSDRVTRPVAGPITSAFGERIHPVHGGHDVHRGIDIAVPVGTAVRVPFSGRVHEVGEHPALGRYVIVEHAHGYRSVFGHLSEARVEAGAVLRAGDSVATSGNTGRSTGPHLHYGLYRDGRAVDPTPFLR